MNFLEERLRYPFEDREMPSSTPTRRPAIEQPEVPRPEKMDPGAPGPVEEVSEPEWEGQEGVGPSDRDVVRREEKGERSPETPPAPPVREEGPRP